MKRREKPDCSARVARVLASTTVHGVTVDVKSRADSSVLQLEAVIAVGGKTKRWRGSARTSELEAAKVAARKVALEFAKELGLAGDDLLDGIAAAGDAATLGELLDLHRVKRLPKLSCGRRFRYNSVCRMTEAVWGRDMVVADIDQEALDEYVHQRTSGGIRTVDEHGVEKISEAVGVNTVRSDLSILSAVFNWLRRLRRNRKQLQSANPLHGLVLPPADPNQRQPITDPATYALALRYAPTVEGVHCNFYRTPGRRPGILSTILVLLRETGKRVGSVRQLVIGDVLLSREQVRRALGSAGWKHQPAWAETWVHGAILWRKTNDKKGYHRVTPLSSRARTALETYMAGLPDRDPDTPLFPSPTDPTRFIGYSTLFTWMRRIEDVATTAGETVHRIVGGQFHPFRRLWRSERSGLFDRKLVAVVGGWKDRDLDVIDDGYLQFLPLAMYVCVEFDPLVHRNEDHPIPGVLQAGLVSKILGVDAVRGLLRHTSSHTGSENLSAA